MQLFGSAAPPEESEMRAAFAAFLPARGEDGDYGAFVTVTTVLI